MKKSIIQSIVVVFRCSIVVALGGLSASVANEQITAKNTQPVKAVESHDDLAWLVGQWRCVTREVISSSYQPSGSVLEDALDYFNVYFPFADDHLTLKLSSDPLERRIAAEFLVRQVWYEPFEERLVPMPPVGPVWIGKDRIFVGNPHELFQFRYLLKDVAGRKWLILESKLMRLGLVKMSANSREITQSSVEAPVRNYSPDRIARLKAEYAKIAKKEVSP